EERSLEDGVCPVYTALSSGEDTVTQPEGDASVFKGDTATINCTFQTTDSYPYLFWYKQEDGNRLDPSLILQTLTNPDSAVYYCALQPTVTGNTKTLNKTSAAKTTQYCTSSTRGDTLCEASD
uniref:Ig-like domain-containing protein n=1 Tax=Neogobius melanostomus TaxID=47308 RepID=A0A8C6TJK9_9GOBI